MRLFRLALSLVFFIVATTSLPSLHTDTIGRSLLAAPGLRLWEATFQLLSKRASHNLQIHHIEILTFAVPLFNAAAALAYFYSSITQRCLNEWTAFPPLYHLRITNGYFSLMLYGNGGRIPWKLVAEMAANMLLMTQRGFVGTYDLWYVDGGYTSGLPVALGGDGSGTSGSSEGPGVLVQFRVEPRIGRRGISGVDTNVFEDTV